MFPPPLPRQEYNHYDQHLQQGNYGFQENRYNMQQGGRNENWDRFRQNFHHPGQLAPQQPVGWGPIRHQNVNGGLRTNPYPVPERSVASGYNPEMTLETMLNTGANGVIVNQSSGVEQQRNEHQRGGRVSEIASAMSQITSNPSASSQGNRSRSSEINNKLNSQLQMALAINLGLNGQQEEKERALHNVVTSNRLVVT